MPDRFSLDRWEDDGRVAVLVRVDGSTVFMPRARLPKVARPGDVLTTRPGSTALQIDGAATRALADETRRLQEDRTKRDPGGPVAIGDAAVPPAGPVPKPAVKPPPAWWAKGGSLDAAVGSGLYRLFGPPVGSPNWVKENPSEAAEVLRKAGEAADRDRALHGRHALSELVGKAPLPVRPSLSSLIGDEALGDKLGWDVGRGVNTSVGVRYVAALRAEAGDRSRQALLDSAAADARTTASGDRARNALVMGPQWTPRSSPRPEWVADLIKERPEYPAALQASLRPSAFLALGPLFPRSAEQEIASRRYVGGVDPLRAGDSRVNANTASAAVLGSVPGFGREFTKAIIEAREQAVFKSAEDFDKRLRLIGVNRMAELKRYLRFPGDPNSDPAGADRAYGDVLAGRPPRLIGPVGAMGGYTGRDAMNELVAGLKPRSFAGEAAELPGVSSRETPMKPVGADDLRYSKDVAAAEARGSDAAELRHALGDYFKRVTAPVVTKPGPGASVVFPPTKGGPPAWHGDANGLMGNMKGGPSLSDALPSASSLEPPSSVSSLSERTAGPGRGGRADLADAAVSSLDRLTKSAAAAANALELRDRYRPPAALPGAPPPFLDRI